MAAKTGKELVTAPSEESVALVNAVFPIDSGYQQTMLPRLGMVSQDKFEGKGQKAVLVKEAGMFFMEQSTEETDENGKAIWEKEELGTEGIDVRIVYQRKQLRNYDEATETFTSSPVYDTDDEIIPLFANKAEIARGTPAELKKNYEFVDNKTGKVKSGLEDNRILYVLYDGVLHQMNLRGSSMYSFMTFSRKARPGVASALIHLSSSPQENGAVSWNRMEFEVVRPLNASEIGEVQQYQKEIIEEIQARKTQFADRDAADAAFAAHKSSTPELGSGK